MLWFWRNNTGKLHGNLLQELSQDFSECLKNGRGTNLSGAQDSCLWLPKVLSAKVGVPLHSKLLYKIFHCLVVGRLLRLIVLLAITNNYLVLKSSFLIDCLGSSSALNVCCACYDQLVLRLMGCRVHSKSVHVHSRKTDQNIWTKKEWNILHLLMFCYVRLWQPNKAFCWYFIKFQQNSCKARSSIMF